MSFGQVTNEFFNDGASVYVQAGGLIYVQGEVVNRDNGANIGRIFNSGDVQLEGNWYNYSPSNVFQAGDPGTTTFLGNNALQMIDGSRVTAFNNLTINKPGGTTREVRQDISASADGVLNLTDDFLNTTVDTFLVLNPNPAAITRTGTITPNYINNTTQGFVTSNSGSTGRLIRRANTAFPGGVYLFPVGTIARGFRPVEITPTSVADNFYSVQLVDLATPNTSSLGPGVSSINPFYYHFIGRAFAFGSPETIRIYYDQLNDQACLDNITIAEWDNSLWRNLHPTVSNVNLASPILSYATKTGYPATYTGTPFNTERFVLGSLAYNPWSPACIILPVELLYLKAKPLFTSIQLDWATASELQNLGYDLERSDNGVDFVKIAWIKGAGTTSLTSKYDYEDKDVEFNVEYTYRLKQHDLDGGVKYSNQVSAMLVPGNELFVGDLYPNPARNEVYLDLQSPEQGLAKLEFYNSIGQVVLASETNVEKGINKISLRIGTLATGSYMIAVTLNGQKFIKKLVVE